MAVTQKVGCNLRLRSWLLLSLPLLSASLYGDSYYLTIAGLGGEQEYEQRFSGWASDLDKILKGEPSAHIATLSGAQATRANIEAKLADVARQAKTDDTFALFLIGHGTYDDTDYKFNIPGPDITASALGGLLDKIPAQQAVIDMTSASGAAIAVLQKPRRVIVTATKSGTEKNAPVFARYFIEALRDLTADIDRNEVISALEAFRYAEGKTAKFYDEVKRLATEHPLIEDTGKGEGVKAPAAENGQGIAAARFALLHTGTAAAVARDPAKQKLLKQKEEIEQQIDELKYRKAAMSVPEYRQQLSKLLVELARTQEALDK